ncbi:MAG: hypothetical protein J6V80_01830 [Clostridia bacterium]|nr:hypothetical protein [Clostridia bacterium]
MKRNKILVTLALIIIFASLLVALSACKKNKGDDEPKNEITISIEPNAEVGVNVLLDKKANFSPFRQANIKYEFVGENTCNATFSHVHANNWWSTYVCATAPGTVSIKLSYMDGEDVVAESNIVTVTFTATTINTVEELKAIANTGKSCILGADIDLSGESNWTPIEGFTGFLSGGGYKILNLNIDSVNGENLGLFSILKGTVQDLTIENVNINVRGEKNNVGIVAGTNKGTVKKVNVGGKISAKYNSCVGGIVGYNDNGSINGCSNSASIEGSNYVGGIVGKSDTTKISSYKFLDNQNNGALIGGDYVGGIAGYVYATSCSVEGCKNFANVYGKNNTAGLFGYTKIINGNEMTVINSSNYADISGDDYVGGMLGYVNGKIALIDTVNEKDINGKVYVGGVLGCGDQVSLTNCANRGNVISTGSKIVDNLTCSYVGGLAGCCGDISDCSNETDITCIGGYVGGLAGKSGAIKNSYNVGDVSGGGNYVGGLSGYGVGSIINCKNEGTIKSTGSYVGGMAGKTDISKINSAQFTDNQNSGEISGEDYIGGIVGYTYTALCSVESCKNLAEIDGKNNTAGLFGYVYLINNNLMTIINSDNSADIVGGDCVGGMLGYVNGKATLINVANEKTITGKVYVGGVLGCGDQVSLTSCENRGSVVATSSKVVDNNTCSYVGGLAGCCGDMTDCSNEIDISGIGGYVGGLAGKSGAIKNGYNSGDISGGGNYVGGLSGYAGGSITDSINDGEINSTSSYVGGLAGKNDTVAIAADITGNKNNGPVIGDSYTGGLIGYAYGNKLVVENCEVNDEVNGANYTGGLFGSVYLASGGLMTVTNCILSADVTGDSYTGGVVGHSDNSITIDRQINNSQISGKAYLGGIVGKGTRTTLKNCENYGKIVSTATITENGESCSYVGGLAGICYAVEYCINETDISANGVYVGGLTGKCCFIKNSTNGGNVTGASSYVGGLVGKIETASINSVEISDSSNYGAVIGKDYVGGIAGYYYGKSCNFDNCSNAGNVIGENNVGGLIGRIQVINSGVMNIVNCKNVAIVSGDSNVDNFNGSVSGKVIIQ